MLQYEPWLRCCCFHHNNQNEWLILAMVSDSNALNPDSRYSGSQNGDEPDSGFELDKLEISDLPPKSKISTAPDIPQKNESRAATASEASVETGPAPSTADIYKSRKASKSLIILIVSSGLMLCLAGFLMAKLMLPISGTAPFGDADLGVYQPIEPIVTNLGDSNYVHIILQLRSPTENTRQFKAFKSKVIDTVFSFLGSADLKQKIAHGGSTQIKNVLYDELAKLLEVNFPNQAVLSEIRLD